MVEAPLDMLSDPRRSSNRRLLYVVDCELTRAVPNRLSEALDTERARERVESALFNSEEGAGLVGRGGGISGDEGGYTVTLPICFSSSRRLRYSATAASTIASASARVSKSDRDPADCVSAGGELWTIDGIKDMDCTFSVANVGG